MLSGGVYRGAASAGDLGRSRWGRLVRLCGRETLKALMVSLNGRSVVSEPILTLIHTLGWMRVVMEGTFPSMTTMRHDFV